MELIDDDLDDDDDDESEAVEIEHEIAVQEENVTNEGAAVASGDEDGAAEDDKEEGAAKDDKSEESEDLDEGSEFEDAQKMPKTSTKNCGEATQGQESCCWHSSIFSLSAAEHQCEASHERNE